MKVGNINTETRCMRIHTRQNRKSSVIIRPFDVDGRLQSKELVNILFVCLDTV